MATTRYVFNLTNLRVALNVKAREASTQILSVLQETQP